MKFTARIVVLILIMNGLLLYMHFSEAGLATSKVSTVKAYAQEIEVINRSEALYIRHHFSGLSEGRYEIVWPEGSTDRICYLEEATSCSRLDEKVTAFVEGDTNRQSIAYQIPKSGLMQETALFKEPFAALHESVVGSTVLHITDETGIGGLWVNGLELIGKMKLELIDYSLFSGFGKITDLYWQKDKLGLSFEGVKLSVYGLIPDISELVEVDAALRNINADHSVVVIDGSKPTVHSTRFIVSETADVESVADVFLINSMYARFSIPQEEQLTAEVTASLLSEKAVGSNKTRVLYEELTENLTEAELDLLVQSVSDRKGQPVNAAILDKLTGEVTGFKTSFFSKNVFDESASRQFLLEDSRNVHIAGKSDIETSVVLKDGRTLYPANKILSRIGYTITSNDQSLYIENQVRKFRFPLKEPFYVYNERRFNVVATPFEVLNGDFYFEENWFIRLFLVDIEKKADAINIVPKSMFQEEGD